MRNNTFWYNYWKRKTCGEHRSQDECFLAREAKEKLFHLDGGNSLLDFGCGSADLFAYYSLVYSINVGVDFSSQMLAKAQMRLKDFDVTSDVLLLNADDSTVCEQLESRLGKTYMFDRITAGQVIQYLDKRQVEQFICNSITCLNKGGLICLFDVVDCRTYELWNAGLFNYEHLNPIVLSTWAIGRLRAIKNKLKRVPPFEIGYMYPPAFFEMLAKKYNLQYYIVHSMYYEYRYHVIFRS